MSRARFYYAEAVAHEALARARDLNADAQLLCPEGTGADRERHAAESRGQAASYREMASSYRQMAMEEVCRASAQSACDETGHQDLAPNGRIPTVEGR